MKIHSKLILTLLTLLTVSACGGTSTTPTTIQTTATIFYAHSLVFKNTSTLLSTGYNGFGQLGTGNLGNRSVPGGLNSYYPFRGYAAGGDHSVAFTNNSSVIYSWGYNGFGQLGNGTTTYSSIPVRSGTVTGIVAVAAGALHSLALKKDGTVWAWGQNDVGQAGTAIGDTSGFITTPRKINGAAPLANISSIAANGKHSLAIAKGGALWAWGLNSNGQIGLDPSGPMQNSFDPVNISMYYPSSIASVTSIAAGTGSSYAVAANGTLWAWGVNDNGQLGNGTTTSTHIPVQVKIDTLTYLSNVVQAAGGGQHGLARLASGEVWAWGFNHFGQLGSSQPDSSYAVKVTLPGSATDIRAFGASSMAMVNGAWYVWGDNTYGQLGVGTTGTVTTPTKMSGF